MPDLDDAMIAARLQGASWPEIDTQTAQHITAATNAGMSQEEINRHLGKPGTEGLQGRLNADAVVAQSNYQEPLKFRYKASPGGQDGPLTEDVRQGYAAAIKNNEVGGPTEFAKHAAGVTPNAATLHLPDTDLATLPRKDEITDHAINLNTSQGLHNSPESVKTTRDNLLDHWADTGEPPQATVNRALQNPSLGLALVTPKPPKIAGPPIEEIDPVKAMVLHHIAAGEAHSYNELYGGGRFDPSSFWSFPEWEGKQGPAGISHAAGLYQFQPTTWQEQATKLGLKDFSPASQDKAAWNLAQETYQKKTGRDLYKDAQIGAVDYSSLSSQWTSLGPAHPKILAREGTNEYITPEWMPPESKVEEQEKIQKEAEKTFEDWGLSTLEAMRAEIEPAVLNSIPDEEQPTLKAELNKAYTDGDYEARQRALRHIMLASASQQAIQPVAEAVAGAGAGVMESVGSLTRLMIGIAPTNMRALIRENRGQAEALIAQVGHALEEFRKLAAKGLPEYNRYVEATIKSGVNVPFNQMPGLAQLTEHMENRGTMAVTHPLFKLAESLRQVYTHMAAQIYKFSAAEGHPVESLVADYVRHAWQQPNKAMNVLSATRTGTGANLMRRSLPVSINEAIALGLRPKFPDPIENAIHYVTGLSNFIAAKNTLRTAAQIGDVIWATAAPHPDWVPLIGNIAQGPNFMKAWASPGVARAWKSWVGTGFYGMGAFAGNMYHALQFASNMAIGLKLALSPFHAINIAKETIAAGLADAFGNFERGQLWAGLKRMGMSTAIVPQLAHAVKSGAEFRDMYLTRNVRNLTPAQKEMLDLFTNAGGRAVGRGQAYLVGTRANITTAIKRGTYSQEVVEGVRHIIGDQAETIAKRMAMTVPRMFKFVADEVGRAMDTAMAPLFDHAIPYVKMAAWQDEMASWIKANPLANDGAKLQMARRLLDRIDDTFGEMNLDNLFVNRALKQTAQVMTVSIGWELGTLRAALGGASDILQGQAFTPRARWLLAYPAAMALTGSIYTWLKTGSLPQSVGETLYPPTGGKTPEGAEERALIPGYEKEPLQLWHRYEQAAAESGGLMAVPQAAMSYAGSKLGPFPQMVWQGLVSGQNWMNQPIGLGVNETTGQPQTPMQNYRDFLLDEITPIGVEQLQQGALRGSNLTNMELYSGIRPTPDWFENPERAAQQEQKHIKYEQRGIQKSWQRHQGRLAYPSQ